MEKRFILAIVLAFLVLFAWQALFVKKPEPTTAGEPGVTQVLEKPVQTPTPGGETAQPETGPAPAPETIQPIAGERAVDIVVETSLYRAVWSNRGAVLKSWKLKKHTDTEGESLELVREAGRGDQSFPLFIASDDSEFDRKVNQALYQPSRPEITLNGDEAELRFSFADESGNRVQKVFRFRDGAYDFDCQVTAFKGGREIIPRIVWGPGFANPSPDAGGSRFGASSGAAFFPPRKRRTTG